MDFSFRHINRAKYPQKHILICEDDLNCQKDIINHFRDIFEPQGLVQFSMVPGALAAACLITQCRIDLVILDHDMPEGNGTDLLNWMKNKNVTTPVITFSGLQQNNHNMKSLGAHHLFNKSQVIAGDADKLIKEILGL